MNKFSEKIETIEKLIVSLDPLMGELLVKTLDGVYMEKSFKDLMEYMLNPSRDDFNPGYTESEQQVATMVNEWIEKTNTHSYYEFQLVAMSANREGPINLDLDEKVAVYGSKIVQIRPIPGEDQSEMPYIELLACLKEG